MRNHSVEFVLPDMPFGVNI